MNAKIVKANGTKVGKGKHAGNLWSYNGSLWMIFGNDNFAYRWGNAS